MPAIVLFLSLAFIFFFRVVIDPDLGWHLMVGQHLFQTRSIPYQDLFSFSVPEYFYIHHSWLADLFLFFFYQRFGLWGINFLYCSLGAAIFWLFLKTIKLKFAKNWLYIFLLSISPLVLAVTSLRPQLFSLLGLAFLYFVFRCYLKRETKLIFLIPIAFVLWANLHGGFFLGLILYFLLLMVEIFNFLIPRILPFKFSSQFGLSFSRAKVLKLFFLFLISLAAVLINPYGSRIYQQVVLMGTNRFAAQFNLDWYPLIRANDSSWILALLLFSPLILLVLVKNKVELREKLIVIIFFSLALKLNRFSLPLLVVLIPAFTSFLEDLRKQMPKLTRQLRFIFLFFTFLLASLFFSQSFDFFLRAKAAYRDEAAYAREMPAPYTYPSGAVEYLKKNQVSERLLNDYNWGGYLIWKLPERKYFIDGRMDNFFINGQSFAKEYQQITNLHPSWQELLEKYQIEAVLISPQWPLAQALKVLPDWQLLYEDETTVLLEKSPKE